MTEPVIGKINWPMWLIIFGFWTFFSFLYANQIYFEMLHNPNMHHSWWRIAFWQLVVWYLWGFLSPLILTLGRKFPLEGSARLRGLLVHVISCVVFSALHVASATALRMIIRPFDVWSDIRSFPLQYQDELRAFFLFDVLVYWAIFGVGYAFDYRERYRERESAASELKAQLAKRSWNHLRCNRIHFLFITLHTIAGLVRSNEKSQAVDMISGLSDLLRHALESAAKQQVTLKEELKFIELYLDIQKVRFSDRLTVQLEVAPDTLNAIVPNLILQPLVENAIRHGISPKNSSGVLLVKSYSDNGELHLVVSDDGPGLRSGWQIENNEGIGLANTNERLKHLYGNRYRFDLRNGNQAGTTASITIPLQISADRNLK